MVRLNDEQLKIVMSLAQPLTPWQRDLFLKAVVRHLAGKEIGDGSVHAAAVAALNEVIATTRYRNVG